MIKNNKVINKILLPKILSFALIVAFTSGASIYVLQDKTQTNTPLAKNDKWLVYFIALLVLCAFADVYLDYKKTEKFSSLIVRKYLQKEFKNHPELKTFENVFDNPRAMQNVSAVIFNSLHPFERKHIAKTILNMRRILNTHKKYSSIDTSSDRIIKEILANTRIQIITILQEHVAKHPEFINNAYSAIKYADATCIVSSKTIQQHTK